MARRRAATRLPSISEMKGRFDITGGLSTEEFKEQLYAPELFERAKRQARRIEELEAMVEHLRGALVYYANGYPGGIGDVAREALTGTPEQEGARGAGR
jgi:hypothetical protein